VRIHGYCDECRRFKQVHVSGHGMAMLAAHNVAHGICADCEEGDRFQRGDRVARRWRHHRDGQRLGKVFDRHSAGRIPVVWDGDERPEWVYPRDIEIVR
jgi:hypothetical protein